MNKKIILSLSGGETSGMLAYNLFTSGFDVTYLFANTGLENNETLDFIHNMEKEWGISVVWLEAVVNPKHGQGITHRVTSYEKAFRANQYKDPDHPYHAFVRKSGIPNQTYKQCSDRLKQLVIEDYKKKNGLSGVKHALGMRFDEPRRVFPPAGRKVLDLLKHDDNGYHFRSDQRNIELRNLNKLIAKGVEHKPVTDSYELAWISFSGAVVNKKFVEQVSSKKLANKFSDANLTMDNVRAVEGYVKKINDFNLCYPLYDMYEQDKQDVKEFWSNQSFGLGLEDHEGNCQTCWKKSDKKLWLLAIEHPERFEAFRWLEQQYQNVKPNNNGNPRLFFRKHRSVDMIIGESKLYDAYTLRKMIGANPELDAGCSESCEAYGE